MGENTSALSSADRKTLKQLFSVIGLFVAGTVVLAVVINLVM